MSDLRILLVGREGNGKRSSAQTIAETSYQNLQVDRVGNGNNSFAEQKIVPVVCRGVGDSGDDLKEDIVIVVNNIRRQCEESGGFNAIVFVLKYGVRFTKQEKNAVDIVKSMFGEDVFRQYGIILMTYGDTFELENEDDDDCRTFETWCGNQTGDIQRLFKEVKYRIVLFNNKTNDTSKLVEQYKKMWYYIRRDMKMCYGLPQFERAKPRRDVLINSESKVKEHTTIHIPDDVDAPQVHTRKQPELYISRCVVGILWILVMLTFCICFIIYVSNNNVAVSLIMLICCILCVLAGYALKSRRLIAINICCLYGRSINLCDLSCTSMNTTNGRYLQPSYTQLDR